MRYSIVLLLLVSLITQEAGAQAVKKIEGKKKHAVTGVTRQPEYPGGLPALQKFLLDNMHYPDVARENNTEGRVIIRFVIGKDGRIEEPKVLRGIGSGCDEEAMRVVKAMPKWIPGIYKGKLIKGVYTLPVTFRLE